MQSFCYSDSVIILCIRKKTVALRYIGNSGINLFRCLPASGFDLPYQSTLEFKERVLQYCWLSKFFILQDVESFSVFRYITYHVFCSEVDSPGKWNLEAKAVFHLRWKFSPNFDTFPICYACKSAMEHFKDGKRQTRSFSQTLSFHQEQNWKQEKSA